MADRSGHSSIGRQDAGGSAGGSASVARDQDTIATNAPTPLDAKVFLNVVVLV